MKTSTSDDTTRFGNTHAEIALAVIDRLFGAVDRRFDVRLWEGTEVRCREPRFTLLVNEPFALRAGCAPPFDLRPGEAFANGWIDVDGDLESAVDVVLRATQRVGVIHAARVAALLARLPEPPRGPRAPSRRDAGAHSRGSDRRAVGSHYDRPLALYRSFLDPGLVYSCAYWDGSAADLAEAQVAKLDHVLRKLQVSEGDTFLDIGCGWGALVMRAAERFGARAVGITVSREQYVEARRRISERGLTERCRIDLCDYRDLPQAAFDKISSIGMIEHVGRENMSRYFENVWRALKPGGLFLNHGIGDLGGRSGARATGFIAKYVFPGGDLPTLHRMLRGAEASGFEVRDVEDLREHYAQTLRVWHANLVEHRSDARIAVGDFLYRVWRLYIAGSAQGFASGRLAVYQSLLSKSFADGSSAARPTRAHLYGR